MTEGEAEIFRRFVFPVCLVALPVGLLTLWFAVWALLAWIWRMLFGCSFCRAEADRRDQITDHKEHQ